MSALRQLARMMPQACARMMEVIVPATAVTSARRRQRYQLLKRIGPGGPKVLSGPFEGMRYLRWSVGSPLLPKIAGTYERELHEAIEAMVSLQPDAIVDVGAGEGYYVAGLARRSPEARVVGFDIDPMARALCKRLTKINGVDNRVTVKSWCTSEVLTAELKSSKRPIVICDTEGAEDEILRPDLVPELKRTAVLVELHDMVRAGVSPRIRERFQATHEIETIRQQDRTPAMLSGVNGLTEPEKLIVMDECRGTGQEWFWMRPRT